MTSPFCTWLAHHSSIFWESMITLNARVPDSPGASVTDAGSVPSATVTSFIAIV